MNDIITTALNIYEAYDEGIITESEKHELLEMLNDTNSDITLESVCDEIFAEYDNGNLTDDDLIDIFTESEETDDSEDSSKDSKEEPSDEEKAKKKEDLKKKLKIAGKVALGTGIAAGVGYGVYKHADNYNKKKIKNANENLKILTAKRDKLVSDAASQRNKVNKHYDDIIAGIDPEKSKKVQAVDDEIKAFKKECSERKAKYERVKGKKDPRTGQTFDYDGHMKALGKKYRARMDELKAKRSRMVEGYKKHNTEKLNNERQTKNNQIDKSFEGDLNKINDRLDKVKAAKDKYKNASVKDKVTNVFKHDKKVVKDKANAVSKTIKGAAKATKVATAPLRALADAGSKKEKK